MPKNKSRRNGTSNIEEARLVAAESFTTGDRVRHTITGKIGEFVSINLGKALPEVWVQFGSDTESRVPISCNPIELELVEKCNESMQSSVVSALEQKLRQIGAIPPGHVSHPAVREYMMGFPDGWTELPQPHGGQLLELPSETSASANVVSPIEQKESPPKEIPAHSNRPQPSEVGWHTSPELHMESSVAQSTDDIPAQCDQDAVVPEVVEELTESEAAERHRLELKVERAFYEAGLALKELKERKLFRSTHSNFDVYCRDRFRFSRDKADLLIKAVAIVDNLEKSDNCRTFLPTAESQVRDLVELTPEKQCEVYAQAVEEAGGRIPPRRIVKGIVQRLKERDTTPPPIPYSEGDVVMIRGMGNPDLRKFDGRWAIVLRINEYTVTLALDGKEFFVKPQFLEPVDPQYWVEIKVINERITRLQLECDLDPAEDAVLEVLRRRTCFTPKQMMLLERMEQDYAKV